MHVLLVFLTIG